MFKTFFNLEYFYGFVFKELYIASSKQNKYINILYMKKCQSLNKTIEKLLDGCSSTLKLFLVKHI